jgi:mono/diheme cytochrome c family protein
MWATNLKVVGVVVGTLLLYTMICNKIPQMQSEVPQKLELGANVTAEQLVAAGDKVFNGIGGCTTCHGLGTRAPNLLTDEKGTGAIGVRCATRRSKIETCKEYLYDALAEPAEYVVPGYQPIMPKMTKLLSPEQVWAVIAFLESQGGTVDVSGADIEASKKAAGGGATTAGGGQAGGGAAAGAAFAGGSTDPKAIVKAAECTNCHKLDGEGGPIAPDLSHVGARRAAPSIRRKILVPDSSITKGYENFAGVMPKNFGTTMNAAQLEALVQYLAARK